MIRKGYNRAKWIADRIATLLRRDRCTINADLDWRIRMIAPVPVDAQLSKDDGTIAKAVRKQMWSWGFEAIHEPRL